MCTERSSWHYSLQKKYVIKRSRRFVLKKAMMSKKSMISWIRSRTPWPKRNGRFPICRANFQAHLPAWALLREPLIRISCRRRRRRFPRKARRPDNQVMGSRLHKVYRVNKTMADSRLRNRFHGSNRQTYNKYLCGIPETDGRLYGITSIQESKNQRHHAQSEV